MPTLLDNLLAHPIISAYPAEEAEMVATALLAAFPHTMSQPTLMTVPLVYSVLRSREVQEPYLIRFDVNLFQDLTTLEGDLLRNKRFTQELRRTELDLQHSAERVGLASLRKEEMEDRAAARRLRTKAMLERKGLTDEDLFVVGQNSYDAATLRWARQSKYNRSLLRGPLYDDVIWQEALDWLELHESPEEVLRRTTLEELQRNKDFPIRGGNALINSFGLEVTLEMVLALREHELLELNNFGRKSLDEVKDWLKEHGLELCP